MPTDAKPDRLLADELGSRDIRVHALSPGPMPTRAASGLREFDRLLECAENRSPLRRLATPQDVGALAVWLVSDACACQTGGIHFVDGGMHVLGP